MSKRTCTIEGCAKPHRARGLCTTHYNHKYQPNRHEKKLVACIWCGAEKLKHSGGGRKYGQTCSEECRMAITYPPKCDLPPDHWALWYGASSQWPRYGWQSCAQCGDQFTARSSTSRYCSNRCAWIASDRRKGVRSADESTGRLSVSASLRAWSSSWLMRSSKNSMMVIVVSPCGLG